MRQNFHRLYYKVMNITVIRSIVGPKIITSSVCCLLPVYASLCIGLQNLLKIRYILFQSVLIWTNFGLLFYYFCEFQKKGPRSKWTVYKHKSDKNKKCLSVGNSGILSVVRCLLLSVVCSVSTVYTNIYRALKYLLKVRYIILIYPSLTGFLIFETFCLGRSKTLPYV